MKTFTTFFTAYFLITSFLPAQVQTGALDFDGVNDHVIILNDAALNLGRSEFTFEAWITADTNNNSTI